MQILAISKLVEGVTPDSTGQPGADQVKHTLASYLDGTIRNFWFQVNRPGAVFILECSDENEARKVMNELPLVVAGMMIVEPNPSPAVTAAGNINWS